MTDTAALARAMLPGGNYRRWTGVTPYDWQRLVLAEPRDTLLITGRQCGKSVTGCVAVAEHVLWTPNAVALVLSDDQKKMRDLVERVRGYVANETKLVASHREALELPNGSKVVGLNSTPNAVRGFTATMVLADEAALWEQQDEVFGALLPTLHVTQGRLLVASTPGAKGGFVWEAWSEGDEARWLRVHQRSDEQPHYSASAAREYLLAHGEYRYDREILAKWKDPEGGYLYADHVAALFTNDEPLVDISAMLGRSDAA